MLMLTSSLTCSLLASRLCTDLRAQSWRTKHWCRSTWVSTTHSTQYSTVPCCPTEQRKGPGSASCHLVACLTPCRCVAAACAALLAYAGQLRKCGQTYQLDASACCCCSGACEALAGQPGQSVPGQTLYMVLPRAPLESLPDLVDDAHRMMAVMELGGEPMGRSLTAGCTMLLEAIWRDRYGDELLQGGLGAAGGGGAVVKQAGQA